MEIYVSSKRSVLLLLTLVLLMTFFLGMMFDQVRGRIVAVTNGHSLPVYKVETSERKMALTIDGFYGTNLTPELLEVLKRHNVKASWFLGGPWVEENQALVKQIAKDGHEIENYSYTYGHFDSLTGQEIRDELEYTSRVIQNLTGRRPRYFRSPFGIFNNRVLDVCRAEGYEVIQWSIDTLDQQSPGVDFIVNRVLERAGDGEIILMHNNAQQTPDALEILLPKLQELGYQIVPLSEVVYPDHYSIENHSGIQKPTVSQGRDS